MQDGSFTIHHRNLQQLATEMYKIHNNLSPSIMKTIFPERSMPYNLRNNIPFQSTNINTGFYGTENLGTSSRWYKELQTLAEFNVKIRTWEPMYMQFMQDIYC